MVSTCIDSAVLIVRPRLVVAHAEAIIVEAVIVEAVIVEAIIVEAVIVEARLLRTSTQRQRGKEVTLSW